MSAVTLYRGNHLVGSVVEVSYSDAFTLIRSMSDRTHYGPIELRTCSNCGSLVVDIERHADWHYGIAAGRPWGSGPPPGFRP